MCEGLTYTQLSGEIHDHVGPTRQESFDGERTGVDYELIKLNVGGVRLQTYRRTLRKIPRCRLADPKFMQRYYKKKDDEYFFDRDPDMFKAVLNYHRTGKLHIPSYVCGPAAKMELEYWGLAPKRIERCCYINYNEWNSTQEALQRLEHDRKTNIARDQDRVDPSATCWQRVRPVVWRIMNRSNSSTGAKIFGVISLLFVVVSIFSFLAETTAPFAYTINIPINNQSTSHVTNTSSVNTTVTNTSSVNTTVTNTSSINTTVTNTSLSTTAAASTATINSSQNTYFSTGVPPTTDKPFQYREIPWKHPTLEIIDVICLSFFIIEYFVRLVFSPKKLKHATTLLSIIDVLAILPDLIEQSIYYLRPDLKEDVNAVGYITILRVIRVLRIFRLVRHSAGLWILIYTLRASFSELMLLFWFMGLGVLVFSSLIYYVEDRKDFESIPKGFWWALITMTTVGYGDMYPKSDLGKVVGSFCAMAGVLMIGFTVPALVNNFMLYYRHIQFAMHVEDMEKEDLAEAEEMANAANTNDVNIDVSEVDVNSKKKNGNVEIYPLITGTDL